MERLLSCLILLGICFPVQAEDDPVLLSRGKPASASSEESVEFTAAKAFDGKSGTRWSSKHHDPQWLMVDLEEPHEIHSVRLRWEKAFGREYEIQVSDDADSWTRIYTTASGMGGIETIKDLTGRGRYVRYFGTARGSNFGHSLIEFEIFGK